MTSPVEQRIEQCWDQTGPHEPHDYRSMRTGWASSVHCPGISEVAA